MHEFQKSFISSHEKIVANLKLVFDRDKLGIYFLQSTIQSIDFLRLILSLILSSECFDLILFTK